MANAVSARTALPANRLARAGLCAIVAIASFATMLPAAAQPPAASRLAGVWSVNGLESLSNPAWDIVGLFSCRCAAETYDYLESLLFDPRNDAMSAQAIIAALDAHTQQVIQARLTDTGRSIGRAYDLADDPAIQCERFSAFRTALHSDPIEIQVFDDRILIRGEDLTVDRVVYLDGRGHPDAPTASTEGHSIGRFEGNTLIVDTVNVSAGLVDDQLAIHSSGEARSIERFTVSDDGRRLDFEFTLIDPVMFAAPLTIRRPRVRTPELELDRRPCEAIAGQF